MFDAPKPSGTQFSGFDESTTVHGPPPAGCPDEAGLGADIAPGGHTLVPKWYDGGKVVKTVERASR